MPVIKGGRLSIAGCGSSAQLWLAWSGRGLLAAAWSEAELPPRVAGVVAGASLARARVPEPFGSVLRAYFAGERVDPARLPADLRGTAFQLAIWRALRAVPRGSTIAYGQLAAAAGSPRAARAAGNAAGTNPLPVVVPCHRAVASGMRIGGYSDGLERKRMLLKLEGLVVARGVLVPG